MRLHSLLLRNFRNYEEAAITFSPQLNYIHGENAQGKTNLLEAIYLLITGRSFRTTHLRDLIRFTSSAFYLEAHFEKNGVDQVLKLHFNGEERTLIHNATHLTSLSALLGILNGVIIATEDHELVKGGPAARRQFLDLLIACESPFYLYHLSRYIRAMKQRNTLLRQRKLENITIWEEQMAESATHLTLMRQEAIEELEREEILKQQIDSLTLSYQTSAPSKQGAALIKGHFLAQYEKYRPRELEQGNTLSGPHRDDLLLSIQGREGRLFASEGQTRSCVTSLRLAQWARLRAKSGEVPLLCIDDVGISLDAKREGALYDHLRSYGQVFITSPRVPKELPPETHLIGVSSGSFDDDK